MGSAEPLLVERRSPPRAALVQLIASHFLCAIGFSVFAFLPKYLMTARGFSQADTGPCTMGMPLGALACSPLVAMAMGRYRKATIVRFSALCFGTLTASFAFHPPPALLPVLTFLVGGSVMGIFNGGSGLTAEVAPQHAMARALGLHGAAGMLGYVIGPLLLEPLSARFGWPSAFLLASGTTLIAALMPLPEGTRAQALDEGSSDSVQKLGRLLLVSAFAGIMHNALWVSHQPLVIARGGHDMRGYFVGMSCGGIAMRVLFGSLPDRLGPRKSAFASLLLYVLSALGMTWVLPSTLPLFGLLHGLAHGVFYPSMAALTTARVPHAARGHALTALYGAFNLGAAAASFGFARVGEAYGPAMVFPCAAALGSLGLLGLRAKAPTNAIRARTSTVAP